MRSLVPVTACDDFFVNPDAMRKYALSLEYQKTCGDWPGERSSPLHEVDYDLFCSVNNRIMNLFFSSVEECEYTARTYFQKIKNIYSEGWVHQDNNLLTAIIYLNPQPPLNTGTSIYNLKKDSLYYSPKEMHVKKQSYTTAENKKEADVALLKNNSIFEETINISNVYNRLVVFDAQQFHAAQQLGVGEENYERLTLVSFFTKAPVNMPSTRIRQ